MVKTTIQINNETWERLNRKKSRPSQTFDEIINISLDYLDKEKVNKDEC
jgi:hypothetical protein